VAKSAELYTVAICAVDEKIVHVDACINKPVLPSDLFDTLLGLMGDAIATDKSPVLPEHYDWWFGGRTLLLVEDNPINQEIAWEMLTSAGFTLDLRADGEEAIAAVQERSYDAVLMDIQMPIMDGFTATKHIRALGDDYADLPIIAMTAHALSGDHKKSLEMGMNGHITKPIDPNNMFSVIAEWVEQCEKPEQQPHQDRQVDKEEILPSLPGIDTIHALERLGGKVSVYCRILRNYSNKNINVADTIEAHIKKEEFTEAAQAAHSLKGSSGNIGATRVYEYATSVEQFCLSQQVKQALAELDKLSVSLQEVIEGLKHLDDPNNEAPFVSNIVIDPDEFAALLSQLQGQLDSDLGEAQTSLQLLQQKAAGTEYSSTLTELEKALNNFDIDTAKSIIGRSPYRILIKGAA